uniref:Uncharacterized protein n=1 Tax=Vespula pensylvanica TaxID=30213 RepID=A0A834PEI9_VESPE|nr:hypothetical protein H0235_000598 [Vespula pensylvanica]
MKDTFWEGEDALGQVTRVDTGSPGVPSYPTLYEISTTMKLERPEKLWAFSMVRRGEEEFLASDKEGEVEKGDWGDSGEVRTVKILGISTKSE